MFQNLRTGSPIYIFNKSKLEAVTGEVLRTENQMDQFGSKVFANGLLQQKVAFLDIVAAVAGEEQRFSHVCADYSITDSGLDGIVLCDNRAEFIEAINAYSRISERVLADKDKHERIVERCRTIVSELDPQKRIEREQAKEIEDLKASLHDLSAKYDRDMGDLRTMLSQALKHGSQTE